MSQTNFRITCGFYFINMINNTKVNNPIKVLYKKNGLARLKTIKLFSLLSRGGRTDELTDRWTGRRANVIRKVAWLLK